LVYNITDDKENYKAKKMVSGGRRKNEKTSVKRYFWKGQIVAFIAIIIIFLAVTITANYYSHNRFGLKMF
jgi:hypothetical protein